MGGSHGNQVPASQSLSQRSRGMPLTPRHRPVTTGGMPTRELSALGARGFHWGPGTWVPLLNTYPNSRLSGGRQICGLNTLSAQTVQAQGHSYRWASGGSLPKPSSSDTGLSEPWQQVLGPVGSLFSAQASSPILCFQFMAPHCSFQMPS